MDKREVLQGVKEAKRRYLLWAGRVEAMLADAGAEVDESHLDTFVRWHANMAKALRHFEEYRMLEEPHQQAHDLFQSIRALCGGEMEAGWMDRLLKVGGWRRACEAPVQDLGAGFKQQVAQVLEGLNRLERRLLAMREAEWEARQDGSWGRKKREILPADWAVITMS